MYLKPFEWILVFQQSTVWFGEFNANYPTGRNWKHIDCAFVYTYECPPNLYLSSLKNEFKNILNIPKFLCIMKMMRGNPTEINISKTNLNCIICQFSSFKKSFEALGLQKLFWSVILFLKITKKCVENTNENLMYHKINNHGGQLK